VAELADLPAGTRDLKCEGESLRVGSSWIKTRVNIQLQFTPSAAGTYIGHNGGYSWLANGTGSFINLGFGANAESPAVMTLKYTGNVGIGTTNPYSTLGISGTASAPTGTHNGAGIFNITNSLTDLVFTIDNNSPFGASIQHRHYTLDNNYYPILLNPLGGNVGIGTNSPNTKLEVSGDIRASASGKYVQLRTSGEALDLDASGAALYVNSATGLYLNPSGGNVGIGTASPGYKLHVNGTTRIEGYAYCALGEWSGSDSRLKKSTETLTNALENITKLSGVSFEWRKDEFSDRNFDDKKHIGVIAQEVEKVYPELVRDDADGYKAVNYDGFIGPLIEAIKELKAQNTGLAERIKVLEEKISSSK